MTLSLYHSSSHFLSLSLSLSFSLSYAIIPREQPKIRVSGERCLLRPKKSYTRHTVIPMASTKLMDDLMRSCKIEIFSAFSKELK
jgi:hypothetical protein